MYRDTLGTDHRDNMRCMENLALIYMKQRRFCDAEELRTNVLAGRKLVLGEQHPHTLSSIERLAITRRALGRKKSADVLLRSCIEQSERFLGVDDGDTVKRRAMMKQWEKEDGEIDGIQGSAQTSRVQD